VRRTHTREDGTEHVVAEELAVLDRAGRVQLPKEYRDTLNLVGRVRLALESSHVSLWPERAVPAREVGGPPGRPSGRHSSTAAVDTPTTTGTTPVVGPREETSR
jgi:hypothetical protein